MENVALKKELAGAYTRHSNIQRNITFLALAKEFLHLD
jgi:hypothetical protein